MSELTDLVHSSLSGEADEEYLDRIENQAATLRDAIANGTFDNEEFTVGLEMEVYAVESDGTARLAGLPEAVFEAGATKELGVHNAEINTDPNRFDEEGLLTQEAHIAEAFETANEAAKETERELVADAMWTIPPAEGSPSYLSDIDEHQGVTVATNMRTDPRYVAIDNDVLEQYGGSIHLDAPAVDRSFPTILFESLATSIQPHLEIPDTDQFPAYYNAAIRTLGPVLALSTNSPFLPPDLYTDVDEPDEFVDSTHHELRIAVFEQSVNATPNPKVRVPSDIDNTAETIERVLEDDLYAPFLREWITDTPREGVADENWEYQYKRSTYWRWLRCVVGGDPVADACDERSLRIEYRPIPTQPTATDTAAVQWLTVGLLRGLVETGHPIAKLPWEQARDSFYNAARDGIEADLAWVTADAKRTTDSAVIFEEMFDIAREGLQIAGLTPAVIDKRIDPLKRRVEEGVTPSIWKRERVREQLHAGMDLPTAITEMQESYIRHSREYDSFAEW